MRTGVGKKPLFFHNILKDMCVTMFLVNKLYILNSYSI